MKVKNIFAIMTMAAVVGTTAMVSCSKDENPPANPSDRAQQVYKGAEVEVSIPSILDSTLTKTADITVTKEGDKFKITGTVAVDELGAGKTISFDLTTGVVKDTTTTETVDEEGCKGSVSEQEAEFTITSQTIAIPVPTLGGDIPFSGMGEYEYTSGTVNGSAITIESFSFDLTGQLTGGVAISIEVSWDKTTGTIPAACY